MSLRRAAGSGKRVASQNTDPPPPFDAAPSALGGAGKLGGEGEAEADPGGRRGRNDGVVHEGGVAEGDVHPTRGQRPDRMRDAVSQPEGSAVAVEHTEVGGAPR